MLNSQQARHSETDNLSLNIKLGALLALGIFIILIIFAATLACSVGFRDADVCWLLSIGRAIVRAHGLAFVDPFSPNFGPFAFVAPNLPLIQYQWLGATIYYLTWQMIGPVGLLTLTGLMAYMSLVALPMSFFDRAQVPKLTAFVLCIFGFGCSFLRIMTRAHTIGMLLFAILVAVNLHYQFKTRRQQIITLIVSVLMMAIWVNVHLLFPLGIAFLGLTFGTNAIIGLLKEKRLPAYSPMQFATLVLATLATLINPWGYHHWLFVYKLYKLMQLPTCYENIDNQAAAAGSPAAIFLIGLALIYAVCLVHLIVRRKAHFTNCVPILYFAFIALVIIKQAVLLPMLVTMAAAGLSEIYVLQPNAVPATESNLSKINLYLDKLWHSMPTHGIAPLMCLALVGAYLAATSRTAKLPEDTVYFKPPMKAIAFLKDHPQKGQMFNEALYGSCMMWYIDKPMNLFIDGRFSSYDPDFVLEYENMMLGRKDWRQSFKKFHIAYVFTPQNMPITKILKSDPDWQQIYSDDLSMILVHK